MICLLIAYAYAVGWARAPVHGPGRMPLSMGLGPAHSMGIGNQWATNITLPQLKTLFNTYRSIYKMANSIYCIMPMANGLLSFGQSLAMVLALGLSIHVAMAFSSHTVAFA